MNTMSEPVPHLPGYTLGRLLGSGTSGRVYEGVQEASGGAVAVKLLTQAFDPRFTREVAILQSLRHPNVLRIVDHGALDGRAYLVTELVRGASLHDVLLMRGLGPAALTQVMAKLAQAVAAAHAQGVLHRDIKPANVLLDEHMEPRLIDFGLAAFVEVAGSLTRSGSALGTPMYMAPEVLEAGSSRASEASDVYALGVILFEGLTARHPFQGPDWAATRQRILEGGPPPLPGVPGWLQAACHAALARDPARRPTAQTLAETLASYADPSPAKPRPVEAPSTPPASASRWGVGDRLGPYEIEAVLGEGGMGTVVLGRHLQTQARHALKLVTAASEDLRQRFVSEAQALAKVDGHPGVVGIHHAQTLDNGESYFALDYVPGSDLERALREGPLPVARALEIAQQLAEALAYVHARGIVHRDLKPANVLIHDEDGRALLADFGLALDPEAQRLTASNAILGTPCYMAPEQAEGSRGDVGPKSDVFSLGAVLYAMLVGEPPFQRAHFVDLLVALLHSEPTPPRSLRREVPPALDALVLRCLEKPPARRPSAEELAQALAALRRGERVEGSAVAWSRLRRLGRRVGRTRAALAAVVCAVALGSGGLVLALGLQRQAQAVWEVEARTAIEAAEETLALADRESLPLFYAWDAEAPGPRARLLDPLDLEALAARGAGSPRQEELTRLAASLRAAQLRAEVEAALLANPGVTRLASTELTPAERAAYTALLEVRAGQPVDPVALLEQAERGPTWAADRLRLLAVRVELDRGRTDAARRLLEEHAPPFREATAWLTAEAYVRDALEATRRLDVPAVREAFARAAAQDPQRAETGYSRVTAVLLEAQEAGTSPRELLPLLDALDGRPPEAAPIYVAAAVDASRSRAADTPLLSARALVRALRLDPEVAVPEEFLLWLALQGSQYAARGDLRSAAQVFCACTRSGVVFAPPQVQLSTMSEVYRSGALDEILRANPDDWSAILWRGLGAHAIWRSKDDAFSPDERQELIQRARDDFDACLARPELRGALRVEIELLQLGSASTLGPSAFQAELDALEERGDFPELWRAYRLAALAYRGNPPRHLHYARLYLDALTRRIEATAAGTLAPDARGADAQRLGSAYAELIDSLLRSGLDAEAREWLARNEVRAAVDPGDLRALDARLAGR